jgi:hypothetical protein
MISMSAAGDPIGAPGGNNGSTRSHNQSGIRQPSSLLTM